MGEDPRFYQTREITMLLQKSRQDNGGWNHLVAVEGWEIATHQIYLKAELRGFCEQLDVGWKRKSKMAPRCGAWTLTADEFCSRGDRRWWGRGKALMRYNSYGEWTRGISINSGCIKTTLGWKTSFQMVHSIGCNFHKLLRHVQQYCLELHTYVVKCENTHGMINSVQPGLSTIWLLYPLKNPIARDQS